MLVAHIQLVLAALALLPATLVDQERHEPTDASRMIWEVQVDAPPEQVWRALTTTDGLRTWLPGEAKLDLKSAGRIDAQFDASNGEWSGAAIVELSNGQGLSLEIDRAPIETPHAAALLGTKWTLSLTAVSTGATIVRVTALRYLNSGGRSATWTIVGYELLLALWRLRETFEAASAREQRRSRVISSYRTSGVVLELIAAFRQYAQPPAFVSFGG